MIIEIKLLKRIIKKRNYPKKIVEIGKNYKSIGNIVAYIRHFTRKYLHINTTLHLVTHKENDNSKMGNYFPNFVSKNASEVMLLNNKLKSILNLNQNKKKL